MGLRESGEERCINNMVVVVAVWRPCHLLHCHLFMVPSATGFGGRPAPATTHHYLLPHQHLAHSPTQPHCGVIDSSTLLPCHTRW